MTAGHGEQIPLFPDYMARTSDPGTSHARAGQQNAKRRKHWPVVRRAYIAAGPTGLTYREAADLTGIKGTSISSTISCMLKSELLRCTGVKRRGMLVRCWAGE